MRRYVMAGMVAFMAVGCAADPDDNPYVADTESTVPATPAEPPAPGEPVDVLSRDNEFVPESVVISVGTEVRWRNGGRNDHDILPVGDPEAREWGVQADLFAPGDEYAHVFSEPGTYDYYCSIHGTEQVGMVGTIIVEA